MNTHLYTPIGLPETLSRMVAEATMEMPVMQQPDGAEFIRSVYLEVTEAFWRNYLVMLPLEARQAYRDAFDKDDQTKVEAWFRSYANFEQDEEAEARGAKVLEDIALKLPAIVREEFEQLLSQRS